MRFSIDVIDKARTEIQERRNNAYNIRAQRISELELKAPEISKLLECISTTNAKLCQAIISGGQDASEIIDKIRAENTDAQKAIKELLVASGYPIDYLEFPYTCQKCKDNGTIMGKNCDCYNQLLMNYAAEELNSNCNIKLHNFDEFRLDYYSNESNGKYSPRELMESIVADLEDYCTNFSINLNSLLFIGGTGLGKTFLSSCIAKNVASKGYSVVFDSLLHLLQAIEDERFGRSNKNTMDLLLAADLVILDDLGSEGTNKLHEPIVYEILNGRINKDLPMIISTNFSKDELANKYNDRIISRLLACKVIPFIGQDIRQIKLREKFE